MTLVGGRCPTSCKSKDYYITKSAESRILFYAFLGGTERIFRNEGRAGFAPLNDLYLYGGKLNRNKNTIKKGKL